MSKSLGRLCSVVTALAVLTLLVPSFAMAQDASSSSSTTKEPIMSYDRLFLGFIEDATVVDRQWWEVQLELSDGDVIDSTLIRGVAAFQPWDDVELGATLAFGNTDTTSPLPDGRGATDLEIWGKYFLGKPDGKVDLAVGAILTIPTGDNTSGLGFDAFALGFFGSIRWNISRRVILSGSAGFQVNEDGEILNSGTLEGQTSERIDVAAIIPLSKRLNVIGEWNYAGERFRGLDSDARLLAGVNWRLGKRGMLRGAIAGGVTDGAPDKQFLVSYAAQFK